MVCWHRLAGPVRAKVRHLLQLCCSGCDPAVHLKGTTVTRACLALGARRLAPPAPLLQRVSDFEGVECAEFDPKPCSLDTLWINDF